jgi:phage gp36-like protein
MSAFLTIEELQSHIRIESIVAITRNDNAIAESAIDAAIKEAKGYLTRYNTDLVFAATAEARNNLLLIFVKDIAVWHLINIVNPNIDVKLREKRYDRAIAWLKDVQKGNVDPDLPDSVAEGVNPAIARYGSEEKNSYIY